MKKSFLGCIALLLTLPFLLGGYSLFSFAKLSADRFVGLNMVLDVEPGRVDRTGPHAPDGELLILSLDYDERISESVAGFQVGDCFTDIHQSVHVTDDGSKYAISVKMYVCGEQIPKNAILRLENVYQRPDGSLYADASSNNYSGMLGGLTIEVAEDDVSVHLEIAEGTPMTSAALIEMDGDNAEIGRQTLGEEETLALSPDAEWALLVEELTDGSVRRTAVNPPFEDAYVEVLLPGDNGICKPYSYSMTAEKIIDFVQPKFEGVG